jgi:aspartate racemase
LVKKLESAGADLLLLCANTLHKVYEPVQKELKIPVLHIADVLANEIRKIGFSTIGLLGTRITMESEFYRKRLQESYNIATVVPDASQREIVSEIIFRELIQGRILDSSREILKTISDDLVSDGAQGIVLGCTELPLILKPRDIKVPMFDTLLIHAASAVNFALQK